MQLQTVILHAPYGHKEMVSTNVNNTHKVQSNTWDFQRPSSKWCIS